MGPVCRIRDDHSDCYGSADRVPFAYVLHLANSEGGFLWLVGYSELCRWKPGSTEIYLQNRKRATEGIALFTTIASGSDGITWAAMKQQGYVVQVQHFEQDPWMSQTFAEAAIQGSQVTALFADREGYPDRCPRRNHLPQNFAS